MDSTHLLPPDEPGYRAAFRTRPGPAWTSAAATLLLLGAVVALLILSRPTYRIQVVPPAPTVELLLPDSPTSQPAVGPRGGSPTRPSPEPTPIVVPGPLQLKAPPAQDDLLSFPLEGPLTSALPTHPGGLGGTLVGTGQGPGEGWGDGSGQGTGGKGILKLLKAERPRWGIRPGDRPKNGDRVQVRLLVGTNGVPFRALPVSGRASLYPAVIRAGLKWRFTVPTGYERFAPFEVTVDFTYRTGDTSSSQVKELQPVEVR